MTSPIAETFREVKYCILAASILILYGLTLLFFDQFIFFAPYFVFYVPISGVTNLILDLALTILTTLVLTVSFRQMFVQRGKGGSKVGTLGIVAAVLAGACPCYYLIPLLAVAGTVGGALGAVGILLNGFEAPIKLVAAAVLFFACYKLQESGVCKIKPATRAIPQNPTSDSEELRVRNWVFSQ